MTGPAAATAIVPGHPDATPRQSRSPARVVTPAEVLRAARLQAVSVRGGCSRSSRDQDDAVVVTGSSCAPTLIDPVSRAPSACCLHCSSPQLALEDMHRRHRGAGQNATFTEQLLQPGDQRTLAQLQVAVGVTDVVANSDRHAPLRTGHHHPTPRCSISAGTRPLPVASTRKSSTSSVRWHTSRARLDLGQVCLPQAGGLA